MRRPSAASMLDVVEAERGEARRQRVLRAVRDRVADHGHRPRRRPSACSAAARTAGPSPAARSTVPERRRGHGARADEHAPATTTADADGEARRDSGPWPFMARTVWREPARTGRQPPGCASATRAVGGEALVEVRVDEPAGRARRPRRGRRCRGRRPARSAARPRPDRRSPRRTRGRSATRRRRRRRRPARARRARRRGRGTPPRRGSPSRSAMRAVPAPAPSRSLASSIAWRASSHSDAESADDEPSTPSPTATPAARSGDDRGDARRQDEVARRAVGDTDAGRAEPARPRRCRASRSGPTTPGRSASRCARGTRSAGSRTWPARTRRPRRSRRSGCAGGRRAARRARPSAPSASSVTRERRARRQGDPRHRPVATGRGGGAPRPHWRRGSRRRRRRRRRAAGRRPSPTATSSRGSGGSACRGRGRPRSRRRAGRRRRAGGGTGGRSTWCSRDRASSARPTHAER